MRCFPLAAQCRRAHPVVTVNRLPAPSPALDAPVWCSLIAAAAATPPPGVRMPGLRAGPAPERVEAIAASGRGVPQLRRGPALFAVLGDRGGTLALRAGDSRGRAGSRSRRSMTPLSTRPPRGQLGRLTSRGRAPPRRGNSLSRSRGALGRMRGDSSAGLPRRATREWLIALRLGRPAAVSGRLFTASRAPRCRGMEGRGAAVPDAAEQAERRHVLVA
jgi:hypothetical protein